jgi:endo-1,4-beta-D-glucanase Y
MPLNLCPRDSALVCVAGALVWAAGTIMAYQAAGADLSFPAAPRHPYGSHRTRYTTGSVLPATVVPAGLDSATAAFYETWKRRYLITGCGDGRAYVFVNADGSDTGGNRDPDSISVSEGHGYGMLITVLMAGHDPQAKTYFDGFYRFFRDHPSRHSSQLMAWNQITGCANASRGDDGADSATDGDLDIAFALALADRQWGSAGSINYREEARRIMRAIREREINPTTHLPLLGDWATVGEPGHYYGTRPSDFMPDHFKAFRVVASDPVWTAVIDSGYRLLRTVREKHSPAAGLVPDFIRDTNTSPRPAEPWYLETSHDGHFSYNACRVPWRVATDYLTSGDPRALDLVRPMTAWMRHATQETPRRIGDGYDLSGAALSRQRAMAFMAPLAVAAMVDAPNQEWLDALWTEIVRTPRQDEEYYGNTLKMLAMIVLSGNWWTP